MAFSLVIRYNYSQVATNGFCKRVIKGNVTDVISVIANLPIHVVDFLYNAYITYKTV